MVRASKGVLVQCDESIMAIIRNIDAARNHEFIMEDLDDETCLVKETKLDELKRLLKDKVKDVVKENEESGSE